METSRNVLILGAGASCPYGFPGGTDLRLNIIAGLRKGNETFARDICSAGFTNSELEDFCEALQYSGLLSIDEFLGKRPNFMAIGKTCIARRIIAKEHPDQVNDGLEGHWYPWLVRLLQISPTTVNENRVAIITFNYDRSLEYFIFTALKHSYGLPDERTLAMLHSVRIVHVHGDVGSFPSFIDGGRAYDNTITPQILKTAASRIQIISEVSDTSDRFAEARELINEASVVSFIGFGYHRVNLNRLWPKAHTGGQRRALYGTCHGLQVNMEEPTRKFFSGKTIIPESDRLRLDSCSALDAFKKWPHLCP